VSVETTTQDTSGHLQWTLGRVGNSPRMSGQTKYGRGGCLEGPQTWSASGPGCKHGCSGLVDMWEWGGLRRMSWLDQGVSKGLTFNVFKHLIPLGWAVTKTSAAGWSPGEMLREDLRRPLAHDATPPGWQADCEACFQAPIWCQQHRCALQHQLACMKANVWCVFCDPVNKADMQPSCMWPAGQRQPQQLSEQVQQHPRPACLSASQFGPMHAVYLIHDRMHACKLA
jgi:hypothetical protein